jgi:NADH-quinone oxidoreductase subunit I
MIPRVLGVGVIKGMIETARNFLGSYYDPQRLPTIEYPDERQPIPENSRCFPMLIFDGESPEEGLRCVACKICEQECPPQCIYIEVERNKQGRSLRRPRVFDLDISVCMGCQICVEVCPFDSIKMDSAFEVTAEDRFGELLRHKKDLAKPNAYFHEINPTEAALADARIEAGKAKAAAKAAPPARMAA